MDKKDHVQGSIQNRRRHFYIKKGFQAKFILRFLLFFMISGVISSGILYFYVTKQLKASYYSAHVRIDNVWDIILPTVVYSTLTAMVVVGLGVIYLTWYASREFTKPLQQFEEFIYSIGDGNLNIDAGIEEKEVLKELADGITTMAQNMKAKINSVNMSVKTINGALSGLKDKGELDNYDKIKNEFGKLEAELKFFKV